MLVARGWRLEVSGTLEVEAELFDIVGIWHNAHARLVVGGAVVNKGDAVAVDAVQSDHLLHVRRGQRFHHGRAGGKYLEAGFRGHAVAILAYPVASKRLQLL